VQPVLVAMVDKKHKCDKHPGGCDCKINQASATHGRNHKTEEYWKVKRFTIENSNNAMLK